MPRAKTLVGCICQVCQTHFVAYPSKLKMGLSRNCSKSCAARSRERQNKKLKNLSNTHLNRKQS